MTSEAKGFVVPEDIRKNVASKRDILWGSYSFYRDISGFKLEQTAAILQSQPEHEQEKYHQTLDELWSSDHVMTSTDWYDASGNKLEPEQAKEKFLSHVHTAHSLGLYLKSRDRRSITFRVQEGNVGFKLGEPQDSYALVRDLTLGELGSSHKWLKQLQEQKRTAPKLDHTFNRVILPAVK